MFCQRHIVGKQLPHLHELQCLYYAYWLGDTAMSAAHPERVQDMNAYMRLIIREAMKYGSNGWSTYDSVFRCNRVGQAGTWDELHPSPHIHVHVAYIADQGESHTARCSSCNK